MGKEYSKKRNLTKVTGFVNKKTLENKKSLTRQWGLASRLEKRKVKNKKITK